MPISRTDENEIRIGRINFDYSSSDFVEPFGVLDRIRKKELPVIAGCGTFENCSGGNEYRVIIAWVDRYVLNVISVCSEGSTERVIDHLPRFATIGCFKNSLDVSSNIDHVRVIRLKSGCQQIASSARSNRLPLLLLCHCERSEHKEYGESEQPGSGIHRAAPFIFSTLFSDRILKTAGSVDPESAGFGWQKTPAEACALSDWSADFSRQQLPSFSGKG